MIITFIRTFILYSAVLAAIRCIGKSGLSSSDPFQIVMMLMIAEIAAIPIGSPDIPLLNGIAAIVMMLFIFTLSEFLSEKSEKFKVLVNGRPSLLIDNGVIDFNELRKNRITLSDFMEMLRLKDAPSAADVLYACLETNGELSVILKPEKMPVTREDMNFQAAYSCIPCILVSDGTIYEDNLKIAGINENSLRKKARKACGSDDFSDVILCLCDETRKLHFYLKSGKVISI